MCVAKNKLCDGSTLISTTARCTTTVWNGQYFSGFITEDNTWHIAFLYSEWSRCHCQVGRRKFNILLVTDEHTPVAAVSIQW